MTADAPNTPRFTQKHRKMLDMWAAHVGTDDPGSPGPALHALLADYDALSQEVNALRDKVQFGQFEDDDD